MAAAVAVNPAVAVAVSMSKTVSDNARIDLKTKKDTCNEATPLTSASDEPTSQDDSGDAARATGLAGLMTAIVCMMGIWLLYLAFPTIAFWIAVGSGESCDVPLDTWCWGCAISSTITFAATVFQFKRAFDNSSGMENVTVPDAT